MGIAVAAVGLQSSQGDLAQTIAALLDEPAAPTALNLHGRRVLAHRLPGGEGSTPLPLWPRLQGLLEQVLAEAGLDGARRAETALFVGTSSHEVGEYEQQLSQELADSPHACALAGRRQGQLARRIAEHFGLGGGEYTLSTACTSSANALLLAAEAIAAGDCRAALVIGEEGINQTTLLGFDSMLLLSDEVARPFDRRRNGMVPGEGLAAMVLLDAALLPQGSPWSGISWLGGASACDPEGITCASAEAMAQVMAMALATAERQPAEVSLLKAHGSASQANDAAEAEAMRALFMDQPPPLVALKGALGHSFGASGLLEMAALLGCLRSGWAPASHGFGEPDPALGCQPLAHAPQSGPCRTRVPLLQP